MIIAILVVLGLCLGSFANALVWRVHEQEAEAKQKTPNKKYLKQLSIGKGRSMCPHCQHVLATKDLLPVFSWLSLGGKCRYCHKPISAQYPIVELAMAGLFVASYEWWPTAFSTSQKAIFALWLVLLVGLLAMLVYDLRWLILPDRITRPLRVVALAFAIIGVAAASNSLRSLLDVVLAVAVGGGVFYLLFQVSGGKWIGGGDVKLGALLGLIVGTPARALLLLFLASLLGSAVSLPLLATKHLKPKSVIPFGPFLIIAVIIVQLFGHAMLSWYQRRFLPFTV